MKRSRLLRGDGGPVAAAEGGEILHARASATPVLDVAHAGREPSVAAAPTSGPAIAGPLAELERWFAAVVTHPLSAASGMEASSGISRELGATAIEQLIKPSARMTALERLAVYHHGYHARLVECLVDDYPIVQHALGDARFEVQARKYIATHPSTGPNLNGFGRYFSAFAASDPFIADLARLEWAIVEVIHAPRATPLSTATLGAIAPESWPELRLMPSPTLRFLELDYPANAYFQAVRDGKRPRRPKPRRSATAVYRLQGRVWRMDFTPSMAAVLRSLLAGAKLGEALEASLASALPDESDVQIWFREWVLGEFFRDPA